MHLRCFLLLLPLASACSIFHRPARLESSVQLGPAGKCTVATTAADGGEMSIELRGLGPGGVTFDARTADGTPMAHGVLTTESTATCFTNAGSLVITFTADARGGSAGYVVRTGTGGLTITTQQ